MSSLPIPLQPYKPPYSHWCPVNPPSNRPDLQSNVFNAILDTRLANWKAIADTIVPPSPYAWVDIPPQARRLQKQPESGLPTPAADGLDHLVLSFTVDLGYDGCITSILQEITGNTGAYIDGSGDLTWRIQVGQIYVPDFGAMTTQLGSRTAPRNNDNGVIPLLSGQPVQYFVNRSTTSGGNFDGGIINVGVFGWVWPRAKVDY